jgi:hypothetical protein
MISKIELKFFQINLMLELSLRLELFKLISKNLFSKSNLFFSIF